jgi:hypothetical protein
MKKTYVENFADSFIYPSHKIKKYNLNYLTLDNTQILDNLAESLNNSSNSLTSKSSLSYVFNSDGKPVEI